MKKRNFWSVIKKNRKGFTLVELLSVIVILGVIAVMSIASISSLISKSKDEKNNQNERTVSMATESYLQANKSQLPKSIGQVSRISLKDLKGSNYITSDIFNTAGESCMENSYVRVYKYSKTGYTYTPYIYCGKEEGPDEEEVPKPTIEVTFTDDKNQKITEAATNVSIAKVEIILNGGVNSTGDALAIDGYNYVISASYIDKNGKYDPSDLKEVFNSGTLSGNMEEKIEITEKLKDYVDVTKGTYFNVKVTVVNQAGGTMEKTIDSLKENSAIYDDTTPPICEKLRDENGKLINGEALSDSEWITDGTTQRVIGVTCNDDADNQSGCVRTNYTKTWPNKSEPEAEFAWITVKDNAGNANIETCKYGDPGCCMVRVNLDYSSPTIKVNGVYKATASGTPADNTNLLKKSSSSTSSGWSGSSRLIANSKDTNAFVIRETDYSGTTNGWFNGNYPNGIVYAIELSDNLNLKGYNWFTNASLSESKDVEKNNVGIGPESKSDGNMSLGKSSKTIYAWFKEDGIRHGTLRAYDKAGNVTEVKISAKLDKVAPPAVNINTGLTLKKLDTPTPDSKSGDYIPGQWSNSDIKGTLSSTLKRDDENIKKVSLSGFENFYITVINGKNQQVLKGDSFEISSKTLKNMSIQGNNNLVIHSCDYAGNCNNDSNSINVLIDTEAPTCTTSAPTCSKDGCGIKNGWFGIDDGDITVTGVCKETGNNGSGCVGNISHTFSLPKGKNLNQKVGPGADGGEGIVMDNAGNKATCPANKTLKIDHTKPTCQEKENTVWTKKDAGVKVFYKCKDETGGSGCPDTTTNASKPGEGGYERTWTTTRRAVTVSRFTIADKAGNETTCSQKTLSVKYDKKAPTYQKGGTVSLGKITKATFHDKITNKNHAEYDKATSGVDTVQYCFTTTNKVNTCKWSTTRTHSTNSCKVTYYVYTRAKDKVGNYSDGVYRGSFTTKECCSDTNWSGCPWYTACRRGITNTYKDEDATKWMGTVCHQQVPSSYWGSGGSCSGSTKLYVTAKGQKRWKIHYTGGDGGSRVSPSSGHAEGYIYANCIDKSRANSICQYSDCPG